MQRDGVYEGDFRFDQVPEEERPAGGMADMALEVAAEGIEIPTNPRIRLDSGKVVWGCECWWGDEEGLKQRLEKSKCEVKLVDIDEVRKSWRAKQ